MTYRDQRFPATTRVSLRLGDVVVPVEIGNVSTTGARVAGVGNLAQGSLVILQHLSQRLSARVIWSGERHTGLRFVAPLSRDGVDALRGSPGARGQGWSGTPAFRELG